MNALYATVSTFNIASTLTLEDAAPLIFSTIDVDGSRFDRILKESVLHLQSVVNANLSRAIRLIIDRDSDNAISYGVVLV